MKSLLNMPDMRKDRWELMKWGFDASLLAVEFTTESVSPAVSGEMRAFMFCVPRMR